MTLQENWLIASKMTLFHYYDQNNKVSNTADQTKDKELVSNDNMEYTTTYLGKTAHLAHSLSYKAHTFPDGDLRIVNVIEN